MVYPRVPPLTLLLTQTLSQTFTGSNMIKCSENRIREPTLFSKIKTRYLGRSFPKKETSTYLKPFLFPPFLPPIHRVKPDRVEIYQY